MTEYITSGRILRGVGGLYLVSLDPAGAHEAGYPGTPSPLAGKTVLCRARGVLRSDNRRLLVGDRVEISYTDASFTDCGGEAVPKDDAAGLPDTALISVLPRKNDLIRPPLANLDLLIVACAAASPAPSPLTLDKVLAAAEYHGIEAAVVIGKRELAPDTAAELAGIYEKAGYPVFVLSCREPEDPGLDAFRDFLHDRLPGRTAAFAGASGVGKSTLINAVFPELELEAGDVSRKIARGRHTTRKAELFPVAGGWLADTPGFSMIDFENFDFFPFEALPDTMREFVPCYGQCRYLDCSHTKEEGCAVLQAVAEGRIAPSRHESYLDMYRVLKDKRPWNSRQDR